jgi:hypothetical protein
MTYYNTYLKDILNNNYVGIKVPNEIVQPYLNFLKEEIGEDNYVTYTENQQNRDRGDYHITVLNVMEFNKLNKELGMDKFVNSLDSVFKYEIDDLKLKGVGTATKNENRAYFIVCESEKLNAIRTRYELEPRDFHVTLGFKYKDVFGVRKNEVMKKSSKFLQLLAQEFYKKDNWNFVKKIENYNSDLNAEIIPLQITDTFVKVKVDGDFMDIVYMEEGEKFWIATKYSANKDLPRLPETEIAKILKNK